jgi:hypothetical protein
VVTGFTAAPRLCCDAQGRSPAATEWPLHLPPPEARSMTITAGGLKVTTPAETLLACARDLGILDVVILADSALRQGDVTLTELKIAANQRRRGAPRLRQARYSIREASLPGSL